MGLLSVFKRRTTSPAEAAAAAAPDAVAAARTRARRRLIGAGVLLAAGVIGFPLLFDTQPRPVAVDIPIEIPRKDKSPPLVLSPAPAASTAALPDEPDAAAAETVTEHAADQGRELPPPAASAASAAATASKAAPPVAKVLAPASTPAVPASRPAAVASKPAPAPAKPAHDEAKPLPPAATKPAVAANKPAADSARAQALLDGKAAASDAAAGRVVVQVGAYTDAEKLREARARVEKLGLKTYTQVVEADGGKRTRVRVGPFANRAEADKAAARLKAAGLPAAILTL